MTHANRILKQLEMVEENERSDELAERVEELREEIEEKDLVNPGDENGR